MGDIAYTHKEARRVARRYATPAALAGLRQAALGDSGRWMDPAFYAPAYVDIPDFAAMVGAASPRLARQLQVYCAVAGHDLPPQRGGWAAAIAPDIAAPADEALLRALFAPAALWAAEREALDATWRVAVQGPLDRAAAH